MDVTCERCGTEYEFDETLVADRGTTVKCTNCGHLFKVFRPDSDGGAKSWTVETADGVTRTLGSLKELQRLIADGVLTPEDRISRGNERPKPLGEIAELATFFEAAATAVATTDISPPARSRVPTTPGPGPGSTLNEKPGRDTLEMGAPAPRKPKSTIIGVGAADASRTQAPPRSEPPAPRRAAPPPRPISSRPPPPPRPPRPEPPRHEPARPQPPPAADPSVTARQRPVSAAARAPSEPAPRAPSEPPRTPSEPPRGRPLYLDDQEPVVPVRGKSRSGLWVMLVVLLAAGVGVALAWPQIAPVLGLAAPADPALPHVDAGDQALAEDAIAGYERAVHHYTQALAHADRDPRVLTGLARAHAMWAQALSFDASDLEARAAEDPARRGEAAAIRREVQRHAETALARAEDAVRHGSGNADAEVALADALRLTGDVARARSRLDRALTLRSDATAETLRVGALIDTAEAGGDLAAARAKAEEAVAEDPGMIRARLLFARALLAARDVGGARQQVEAILRRSPQHPSAVALRAAIDEGRPPAPPTVDVPDAGPTAEAPAGEPTQPTAAPPQPAVAVAPTAPTEPTPSPRVEAPRRGESSSASESGPIPAGRDYSWYIRQGDSMLGRNDLERARAYYEAARGVRASGSEALTGLGYVALETGDAAGAAAKFRQAAGQGYAEAYIGLGQAYRRMGRTSDALTAFQRYLERLPGGPRASVAQRNIDELRAQGAGAGGGGGGGGGGGAGASEPRPAPEPAPATPEGTLPPPRDMDRPPPQDVPAVESDPDLQ